MRRAAEEVDESELPPLVPVDSEDEQELPGTQEHPEIEYSPESPAYDIDLYEEDAEERKRQALDDVPEDIAKRPRIEDAGPAPTESRGTPNDEAESEDESIPPQTESRDQTVARARSRSRERRFNNSSVDGTLLQEWDRTGTTGRGLRILQREGPPEEALLCFLAADRLKVPFVHAYSASWESKNAKKEQRGKTLNYDRETKEVREGLDISRGTEWCKWINFTAGRPCRG